MTDSQPLDPTEAFRRLGRIPLGRTDVKGVLNQVAHLAACTIPGADEVSVTLVDQRDAHTAAYTGPLALRLVELQYGKGYGPCLEASASCATLSLPDMTTENRWPDWTAQALAAGAHSSLSIGLPVHEQVTGALNVYATEPGTFDTDAIILGQTFASYAAITLTNAHMYDVQAGLARQMQAAMQSRAVIEQAKGIIMAGRSCAADEAFAILTKISQDTNRKVREVAVALVASATPDDWA
jgi:GAF domain-containing protein